MIKFDSKLLKNWFEESELPSVETAEDLLKAFSEVKSRFNGTPDKYTRKDYLIFINAVYAALRTSIGSNAEEKPGQNIEITDDRIISAIGYRYNKELNSFAEGERYLVRDENLNKSYVDSVDLSDKPTEIFLNTTIYTLEPIKGEDPYFILPFIGNKVILNELIASIIGTLGVNVLKAILYINEISKEFEGQFILGSFNIDSSRNLLVTKLQFSKDVVLFNSLENVYYSIEDSNYETIEDLIKTPLDHNFNTGKLGGIALGENSHAEGENTKALGINAHAEGCETEALGSYSHAEGRGSSSFGRYSHAEGYESISGGHYTHAEGRNTQSQGQSSHSEGEDTSSDGLAAHAEGLRTLALGRAVHAEGDETIAKVDSSHAEGSKTQALAPGAHAEGIQTESKAPGSHAEGSNTIAEGTGSHAEGVETIASAPMTHAEGLDTLAIEECAHVEGCETIASGYVSHALGYATKSSGDYSNSQGTRTLSRGDSSHSEGANLDINDSILVISHDTLNKNIDIINVNSYDKIKLKNWNYINYSWVFINDIISNDDPSNNFLTTTLKYDFDVDFIDNVHQETLLVLKAIPDSYDLIVNEDSMNPKEYFTYNDKIYYIKSIKDNLDGTYTYNIGNWLNEKIETFRDEVISFDDIDYGISYSNGENINNYTSKWYDSDRDSDVFINSNIYNIVNFKYKNDLILYADEDLNYRIRDLNIDNVLVNRLILSDPVEITINKIYPVNLIISTESSGKGSHAEGLTTLSSNDGSHSEGLKTEALGGGSHAEGSGSKTTTRSYAAHAEGKETEANVTGSHTEGFRTKVTRGVWGHAEGQETTSSDMNAHAEGYKTLAEGRASHTEGKSTYASSDNAHAEGENTMADDKNAHAEGLGSMANNIRSHAEGLNTLANQDAAHAEGDRSQANGQSSHAEGCLTDAMGYASHAEGLSTKASGKNSHAEGFKTNARQYASHSEGAATTSFGMSSHSEGKGSRELPEYVDGIHIDSATPTNILNEWNYNGPFNIAVGNNSHTEGLGTIALSEDSHAEGHETQALGIGSHAEGGSDDYNSPTKVTAKFGHAEGWGSVAGDENLNNMYASHAEGYKTTASGDYGAHSEGQQTIASGPYSHAEGYNTKATRNASHTEGLGTYASGHYSHAEGRETTASGEASHAEGKNTQAIGDRTHAEGTNTVANSRESHAEGWGTRVEELILPDGTKVGDGVAGHAEGVDTLVHGRAGHAEGSGTIAYGTLSHAEGHDVIAIGKYSHAEGEGEYYPIDITVVSVDSGATTIIAKTDNLENKLYQIGDYYHVFLNKVDNGDGTFTYTLRGAWRNEPVTTETIIHAHSVYGAYSNTSHSEGSLTIVSGSNSHAEGYNTLTLNYNEHAEGKYNLSIPNFSQHTIGIGSGIPGNVDEWKNAVLVGKDGRVFITGIGGYLGTEKTGPELTGKDLKTAIDNAGGGGSVTYISGSSNVTVDNSNKTISVDGYTKEEINSKLSTIYTYVGSWDATALANFLVGSEFRLPETVSELSQIPSNYAKITKNGDVVNVDVKVKLGNKIYSEGTNFAVTAIDSNITWDALAGNYATLDSHTSSILNEAERLYFIGVTELETAKQSANTNASVGCYIENNKLYSNNTEVLTLSNIPKEDPTIGEISYKISNWITQNHLHLLYQSPNPVVTGSWDTIEGTSGSKYGDIKYIFSGALAGFLTNINTNSSYKDSNYTRTPFIVKFAQAKYSIDETVISLQRYSIDQNPFDTKNATLMFLPKTITLNASIYGISESIKLNDYFVIPISNNFNNIITPEDCLLTLCIPKTNFNDILRINENTSSLISKADHNCSIKYKKLLEKLLLPLAMSGSETLGDYYNNNSWKYSDIGKNALVTCSNDLGNSILIDFTQIPFTPLALTIIRDQSVYGRTTIASKVCLSFMPYPKFKHTKNPDAHRLDEVDYDFEMFYQIKY